MPETLDHDCPGTGHVPVSYEFNRWSLDTCGDGAIEILFCPYCGTDLRLIKKPTESEL